VPAQARNEECRADARERNSREESPKRLAIKTRVIVSISSDLEFDRRLRLLAMQYGQIIIRVESMEDALRIVEADCCGVILLDLDSIGSAALEMAGDLLRAPLCPPVILLTGQSDQLGLRMTVFAGCILEKSTDMFRILHLLKTILQGLSRETERVRAERGIVRWEDSGQGPVPSVPVKRFWGINE
jgi:hypothetical protein